MAHFKLQAQLISFIYEQVLMMAHFTLAKMISFI